MKILWLVNCPLPEASSLMNEIPIPFGGWLVNTCKYLSEYNGIKLSIAFPKEGINDVKVYKGDKIEYYVFPKIKNKKIKSDMNSYELEKIVQTVRPDLVHIFGTEYNHTLVMINICKIYEITSIVSIQGLISIIARHYFASLPVKVQNKFTLRDFIRHDNLKQQQKKFIERGKIEIEALKKSEHVIGRTTWDKACTYQINSKLKYHFCNEIMREEFYLHSWDLSKCQKFSIFISQGSYPIKGLHYMLEAMSIIIKQYPKSRVYIGGTDIIKENSLKDKLKMSSYSKYIKKLINEYKLRDNVYFTGILDEKEMCERFLNANVFVSPSSIENSPNSLCEAMLLGVPCISSDVGGVTDLMNHTEEGYIYQADAPYMLAYYICMLFENDNLALAVSSNARSRALITHSKEINITTMINIYKNILSTRE